MILKEIDPKGERNSRRRKMLGQSMRQGLKNVGDLEGYAIVMWDGRGDCVSNYYTASGPIIRSFLPSFVKDALNRHIAVDIGKEQ